MNDDDLRADPDRPVPMSDHLRLGETGSVYVTRSAALEYQSHPRAPTGSESARLDLTRLLLAAKRVGDDESPERWRYRSRRLGIDIAARVERDGLLALVVHVHVRDAK